MQMRTAFGSEVQQSLASMAAPSLTGFFKSLAPKLTKTVKQAVDSPEERRAIEDDLLELYDKYAAPALPAVIAKSTREYLFKIVDGVLSQIGNS